MPRFDFRAKVCVKVNLYCKALGIRLTGLPLGRKRTGEAGVKENRQMRKAACERNSIERNDGVAKRKYCLDLIMSRLDEPSKTEAALITLAMNAAHRLRRWLLHFSDLGRWKLFFSKPYFFMKYFILSEIISNPCSKISSSIVNGGNNFNTLSFLPAFSIINPRFTHSCITWSHIL